MNSGARHAEDLGVVDRESFSQHATRLSLFLARIRNERIIRRLTRALTTSQPAHTDLMRITSSGFMIASTLNYSIIPIQVKYKLNVRTNVRTS
jgi:hypothetical protein